MTTATSAQLIVRRLIAAPRERVFDIMTNPDLIHRWLNGTEAGTAACISDIRVGGKFKCEMFETGITFRPHGEWLEIKRPSHVKFTWSSEGFVENSIVTIELHERGDDTEVILSHELPMDEELRNAHRNGWTWALSRLTAHAEIGTAPPPARPSFTGGVNIAMKVPPHTFDRTVAFYRSILGIPVDETEEESVAFRFGPNRLWIDRVPTQTQSDVWLQIETPDIEQAEAHFRRTRTERRDEIETLPDNMEAFWITNPAGIVHLVSKKG